MLARIPTVRERDEFGFPSFWQLQVAGCAGLYLLDLLSLFPYRSRIEIWQQTVFCATVLFLSPLLRPVCRSLLGRSLPWISLEIRAFGWAAAYAIPGAFLAEIVKLHSLRLVWPNFLDSWLAFSVLFFLWCTLYFSTQQWQQSAHEKARLLRAESEAREARLSALRYQLNPHFLFNSLNAVSTLVLEGNAPAATRTLAQIADLLRFTLDRDALGEIPLAQELAFVDQYLAIEQIRLGDRIQVFRLISDESRDAAVPAMLLQPLVENAVRHGIATSIDGGKISIAALINNDRLVMRIENSGPSRGGLQPNNSANGIGLTNTAERLRTLYADKHRFAVEPLSAGGFRVTIEIPFRKASQSSREAVCAR